MRSDDVVIIGNSVGAPVAAGGEAVGISSGFCVVDAGSEVCRWWFLCLLFDVDACGVTSGSLAVISVSLKMSSTDTAPKISKQHNQYMAR